MVGFFDNVEAAAAEAVAWNEKGFNVFTNLNKIDLDEAMRGALNKPLQTAGRELRCANKGDVMEVNWLLVDVDPVRACDNQHVPATDDEQQRSYEVADAIEKFICDELKTAIQCVEEYCENTEAKAPILDELNTALEYAVWENVITSSVPAKITS